MLHTELSPIDQAIESALERLGASHQHSADTADTAETRAFFRRWAGAFRKALLYYRQGVRPERLSSGAWLVPSATRAIVHQVGRDNHCTCEARDRGCWHAAIVLGVEVGYEDLDTFDPGDDDSGDDCPDCEGAGCSTCDGSPLTDAEIAEQSAAPLVVGAYVRNLLLAAMLDRSDAQIAALRSQVTMPALAPAAGSHDYYTQIAERRQAAGLDCCGRPQDARDTRPLSLGQRIARQRARVADVRGDW